MSPQITLALLAVCATLVTLITEAVKKAIVNVPPNLVALIVSVVTGIAVPVGYMILSHLSITAQDIVYIIATVVLTWLISMLGYDKVIQSLLQLKLPKG